MRSDVLLFLLLALPAAAQLPNPVTSGDHFDISGVVLDSVTAKPIPRAQITLQGTAAASPAQSARTNESGGFQFRNVPLGVYDLSATRQGYAQGDSASRKLILVSGTQPDNFTLTLQPQAVLAGLVTDSSTGNPVPDAQVLVLRPKIAYGHRVMYPREATKTDRQGTFRIAGLAPGSCYLSVIAGSPSGDARAHTSYPVTYFPGTIDPVTAQTVTLQAGAEQQANVSLTSAPWFHVRGRVSPPGAAHLNLQPPEESMNRLAPAFQQTVDPDTGVFDLSGVPEGTYVIQGVYEDSRGREYSGYRQIAVSGNDVSDVSISMAHKVAIRGNIQVEGEQTAGQVVSAIGLQSNFDGFAVPIKGSLFSLEEDIPPGRYQLSANLAPNWYIKSATQGGRDVLHGKVLIADDGTSLPLQLSVSPLGSTIEATVTWPDTGHRVPAHVIVLQPNGGEMLLMADAKVFAPNEPAVVRPALIGALPAGDYVVYAWPEPLTVEYANPDALRPFEPLAQQVSITEGQLVRVALKLALP